MLKLSLEIFDFKTFNVTNILNVVNSFCLCFMSDISVLWQMIKCQQSFSVLSRISILFVIN